MAKPKKEFTWEDINRAINMALKCGNENRARVEGKRDAIKVFLALFDGIYEKTELKTDQERIDYLESIARGLYDGYRRELHRIDAKEYLSGFGLEVNDD